MPVISFNPKLALLVGLIVLTNVACQRKSTFFFVKNKGAIMPVKVSGAKDNSVYLILLPGGPAGDGLIYQAAFPVFRQQLESRYQVVYYDQRGSGNCQGKYPISSLNLAQLTEDLDRIVTVLKEKDPAAKIFLMGYSFGGTLGIHYLLNQSYQIKITGFISIDGAFDRGKQAEYQNRLINYLLREWVNQGEISDPTILMDGNTCATAENVAQCRQDSIAVQAEFAQKLDGLSEYRKFPFDLPMALRLSRYAVASPSNPFLSGANESQHGGYYHLAFDSLIVSPRVGTIKMAALFLNGRYDTNVPFFDAEAVFAKIGTPKNQKWLKILENSGHIPMVTEPDTLAGHIIEFVEATRPQDE